MTILQAVAGIHAPDAQLAVPQPADHVQVDHGGDLLAADAEVGHVIDEVPRAQQAQLLAGEGDKEDGPARKWRGGRGSSGPRARPLGQPPAQHGHAGGPGGVVVGPRMDGRLARPVAAAEAG